MTLAPSQDTKNASRKIIHVDMDAFFASVEQRDDPSIRGKPVVVGGAPDSRGVVAAASYEARKFGIHSAMPSQTAYRLCPHAIFVKPHFEKYRQVSLEIRDLFFEVTDLVEPLSLDEAYLDVTSNHKNELATPLAKWIKEKIYLKTGLTASAGVGPNKFIAKIASDWKKPNGLTVIRPHQVEAFISKLAVEKIYGVGKVTEKKLKSFGIFTTLDLRNMGKEWMTNRFGRLGEVLFERSFGRDDREIQIERTPKSKGREHTFLKDLFSISDIETTLQKISKEVFQSLEKDQHSNTLTLKVRFSDFETLSRSVTNSRAFESAEQILKHSKILLERIPEVGVRGIRLLGLALSVSIDQKINEQLWLDDSFRPEQLF